MIENEENLEKDENNSTYLEYLIPLGQNEPNENRVTSDAPTQPLQQRARGRPRKIKTGRKGRPALEYRTAPVSEENTDSYQDSENLTETDEGEENIIIDDDEDIQISSLLVNENVLYNAESELNMNSEEWNDAILNEFIFIDQK